MTHDRRDFLKRSGAAISAAALAGCAPEKGAEETNHRELDGVLLRSVAAAVLPSLLDADRRERAVGAFEAWAGGYEPVAELNHGYGTHEIRYGPPDPLPTWKAQLEALDLEARKRHGAGFAALGVAERDALLRRTIPDQASTLPNPLRATHVAVALMAHWFASAEAVDECYGVRISPRTCRGLDSAPQEPGAVS